MSDDQDERLASAFAGHRPYLHAMAYRMLGGHADADDAVQEAWVRLARAGGDGPAELRAWLTTVTARICLDMLRARGARGEQPLEISMSLPPGTRTRCGTRSALPWPRPGSTRVHSRCRTTQ